MRFMKAEITVIVVTLNSEKYLKQTLDSIVSQKLFKQGKVKILIQDGFSRDKTLIISRKFKKKYKNIKISIQKDFNHFDAMNKAAKKVTTKYLLFLHSDDYFCTNQSLNTLYLNIKKKNWCCAFVNFINEKNLIFRKMRPSEFSFNDMLISNRICHQTVLIKTNIHKKLKFDTKFSFASDYLFFLNVWEKFGSPKIIHQNIVNQRFDGKNISSNFYLMLIDEFMCRIHYFNKKKIKHSFLWLCIFVLRYLKLYFFYKKK